nr:MAG TPA: hypothetical protein [Caudoviricetes sp.]
MLQGFYPKNNLRRNRYGYKKADPLNCIKFLDRLY